MKKGFTLIELLSVIIILSIISVLAVPQILNMLEHGKVDAKNKQEAIIKTAVKLYIKDFDLDYDNPVKISELCDNDYIDCPLVDIYTEEEIIGFFVPIVENNVIVDIKHYEGEPLFLYNTIIDTVDGKDIDVNKYDGNGLYKWSNKYIYRGGITKTNDNGLSTLDYASDKNSGSEVDNYIKVPWETYETNEDCKTNKCWRIISINEDSTITIVRDENYANKRFDNTVNTGARIIYNDNTKTYGYNDLLENTPTEGHPEEYRPFSEMYMYLYGTTGYQNTVIKPYISLLQTVDICLNKVKRYAGINHNSYSSTTYVTDTCNVEGKPDVVKVPPLKNQYVRLPYTEEYLNATLEDTCTIDEHYQCRNKNFMYNIEHFWVNNGQDNSYIVRSVTVYGTAYLYATYASDSRGVRPVVTLKSTVLISSGSGSKSSPYVILW